MMDEGRAALVRVWANMIARCHNPDDPGYANYGGRGLKVSRSWHTFANFYRDMNPRPEGLTLERKGNDLGYSKENCVWADATTQANNRRSNIPITCDGTTRNLAEWARISGNDPETIIYRIRQEWDTHDAIFVAPYAQRSNNVIIEHEGRRGTVKQWEEWTGIPHGVIRTRICEHEWDTARALSEPVGTVFGGKRGGPRHDNVFITIDGETKTLAAWSRASGVSASTIRNRVKQGLVGKAAVWGRGRE